MSTEPNAAAEPVVEPAAPAAEAAPSPAPTPEPAPEPAAEPTWPDDWRNRIVSKLPEAEREKELKRLARFASLENLYKSQREIERKMSAGMLKPTLDPEASEAEVAEYRKAHGIPAEATAEAYGVKFPEGYQPNEADQADVSSFLAEMHKDNVPPATVQKVWNQYLGIRQKAEQQLYEAAQQQTINYKAELKAEYGRDFDRNVRLGNAHLIQAVGEDQAKAFMALTLADGTKLGDNPAFVRYIVNQALATSDEAALATSEFGDSGKSLDDQYKELLALRSTDPKTYHSAETQDKLMKLAARRAAKQAA
jgi:hypothetical protein